MGIKILFYDVALDARAIWYFQSYTGICKTANMH